MDLLSSFIHFQIVLICISILSAGANNAHNRESQTQLELPELSISVSYMIHLHIINNLYYVLYLGLLPIYRMKMELSKLSGASHHQKIALRS